MNLITTAKIVAENPPSIAMAIGGIMVMAGQAQGWLAFFSGVLLQVLWLVR